MIEDGGDRVLWSATFEPGDLSEWTGDGQGGTYLENASIPGAAATDVTHNGRFAGKCAVTPVFGLGSFSYMFRRQPSPREAYYSAWFYLSPALTVGSWLSLLHFNGSHTGDGRNVYPTWDVNLYPQASGALVAHLFNFVTQTNVESVSPVSVPTGRWVHFEVLIRKATDATGRVAVWQDDVLILDADGVVTTENDWMEWNAGAASTDVTPSPGVVYIDDAASACGGSVARSPEDERMKFLRRRTHPSGTTEMQSIMNRTPPETARPQLVVVRDGDLTFRQIYDRWFDDVVRWLYALRVPASDTENWPRRCSWSSGGACRRSSLGTSRPGSIGSPSSRPAITGGAPGSRTCCSGGARSISPTCRTRDRRRSATTNRRRAGAGSSCWSRG